MNRHKLFVLAALLAGCGPQPADPKLAAVAPCVENEAGLRAQIADLTQQRAELISELQEQAVPTPPPPQPPRPSKRRDDIVCRAEADGGGCFVVGAGP